MPPTFLLGLVAPIFASAVGDWLTLGIAFLTILCLILLWQLIKYKGLIASENEALRNQEDLLRRSEALSPVMSVLIGVDYRWQKVPQRFCELLGVPEEQQLIGRHVRDISEPEDYLVEMEECRALIDGSKTCFLLEKRFFAANGGTVWCSMNASIVHDRVGHPEAILAYFIDVTERKRAEASIRRNEELNRQILANVPGGYILISNEGKFLRANEDALTWFNVSIDQLKKMAFSDFEGKTFKEDGSPLLPAEYPATRCLETQEPAGAMTIGYKRNDGQLVWGVYTANPMRDSETGVFTGVVATFIDLTERKRAEEELAQALEFLEGVIHKAPAVAIQVFSESGCVELWNPASERLYGYQASEVIGRKIQEILLEPSEVPVFQDMLHTLAAKKQAIEPYEWTVRHRSGVPRHVVSSMFALPRPSGDLGICCIDLDISERKRAEEELRRSEERYRSFVQGSSEAIWRFECPEPVPTSWPIERQIEVCYSTAYLAECNDMMAKMYGYSKAEEITGISLSKLLPHDDSNIAMLQAFVESGYRLIDAETHELDREGNQKIFLNSLFGTISDGAIVRVWGTQRDITDRVAAEQALRRSETLLRQVLSALPVGVWVADETGKLILGNPRGKEIWGDVKEVGGHALERARGWWHQNGREIRQEEWGLSRAIKKGEISIKEEIDIECFNGQRKTIVNSSVPIRNESGAIVGAIVVNEDITERMRLEEQLRHSQKMESIGQLAAGVAHDFNNILTIIRGHVDLLLRRKDMPSMATESLEQAADAADRAASLTRQLLLFSNRQVIQQRQVDVNFIVENTLRLLRRTLGENIQLDFFRRTPLPTLYTDPAMIEQIVTNLAINARDAMPVGGTLTFKTNLVEFNAEEAEKHPEFHEGAYLVISVHDTGCGMDTATLNRIFEPFFTTKGVGRGTGLGLATVYGIVKRHQGWIETESTPGIGTSFHLYFPADPTAFHETEIETPRPAPPEIRGGNETILLVEDEAPLLDLVKGVLSDYGYAILPASDGPEAMEIWKKEKGNVDLLLTDMMMPQGISGRDLAKHFLIDRPDLAIIYSSGYSVELFGDTFGPTDRCRFLEKPYAPSELCRLVREVLDSQMESAGIAKTEK